MKQKEPSIDWMKAAILERMEAFGFSREDVCTLANISAPTFRAMMARPAAEWDFANRRSVLRALHINVADLPKDVQISIAQNIG